MAADVPRCCLQQLLPAAAALMPCTCKHATAYCSSTTVPSSQGCCCCRWCCWRRQRRHTFRLVLKRPRMGFSFGPSSFFLGGILLQIGQPNLLKAAGYSLVSSSQHAAERKLGDGISVHRWALRAPLRAQSNQEECRPSLGVVPGCLQLYGIAACRLKAAGLSDSLRMRSHASTSCPPCR